MEVAGRGLDYRIVLRAAREVSMGTLSEDQWHGVTGLV